VTTVPHLPTEALTYIQGVPEDFIYICTEVCDLTLHIVSTKLFKTALQIIDRFSAKRKLKHGKYGRQ